MRFGESVYIIMCCELSSSTGKKFQQLCHKFQADFDVSSRSRKELFKLADIAKSYKPKFTAANFFVVRKGTILGIIHIATTYLIVIIQFNSKGHEKNVKDTA
ncbi:hypothetical protein NQ314_008376 [Rhamnusium bicolor]|uniref:Uncharacterized protein n=1 Tax=Rhamnusium bicolor TaxID=1586634 RepID=A0AAV8YCI3_9CUCU|nr:hypothetical protein NQ314_008376 [Rhamnusium bicolor]